jgi:hypothetical protein
MRTLATPNFTSDLLVAPRNVQQGETLYLSRLFSQADGDTRPSFLAFGLHCCYPFSARLVRDLDQHTHPSASMAQHNPFIEWYRRAAPQGASTGYDETTRTLIVFGGESESGIPTSKTYLCVPVPVSRYTRY